MDQIAEQLRAEIESLEVHIQRTSDRFLAAQWAGELIEPFEQLEEDLDAESLREAVQAMYVARARFKVNGHLAHRIDSILDRHRDLIDRIETEVDPVTYEDVAHEAPASDPSGADSLFEDEESSDSGSISAIFDGPNGDTTEAVVFTGADTLPDTAHTISFSGDEETAPAPTVKFSGDEEVDEAAKLVTFSGDDGDVDSTTAVAFSGDDGEEEAARLVTFEGDDGDVDSATAITFTGEDAKDESASLVSFAGDDEEQDSSAMVSFYSDDAVDDTQTIADFGHDDETADSVDDLFSDATPSADSNHDSAGPAAATDGLFKTDQTPASAGNGSSHEPVEDKRREATLGEKKAAQDELFAIFSDKVSLDDLQAALDITLLPEDLRILENQLRARMSDRVLSALRSSKIAEGQYILLPRIARFVENGAVIPCTLKNLAQRFHQRFGDIRDLMRYRNEAMMTSEIPEPGWALITPESPRESLGKNYMEQNQYLRYLATSLSIPSHLLRRRTMVEGIYDLIVGQMVLGKQFQRQSLDWTASSPAKNDFVCVYHAPEGIRVRDLSRTTHHPSLGVSPNW
ncbi:MAG: hypothetical protein HN712_17935 [Gemmatimonadetes bacterium]|nr:hypothetical protein [Gemmatimonadota bacterium]